MTSTLAPPLSRARTGRRRPLASCAATVGLASLFVLFAGAHLAHWRRTGSPTGLVFAAQELVLVGVFLARRRPLVTSTRLIDWMLAAVGGYAGLLLRPTGSPVLGLNGVWLGLQVAAVLAGAACMLRLGRSFGVVPANRGIECRGPYRHIRHPIYAAHLGAIAAYVLGACTPRNLLVLGLAIAGQVGRIVAEERVLSADASYRSYRERVRYRLLPGIF